MPILVQVTAEQAQILEEDAIKACDPDSNDWDTENVVPKAHDLDFGNCDPEEIAMNLAIATLFTVGVVNTRKRESSLSSIYSL